VDTPQQYSAAETERMVREQLWHPMNFFISPSEQHLLKIPRALFARLCQVACYAA